MQTSDHYLRIAAFAGLAATLARLAWLAAGTTDLYPDEAQYWLWSRDLDWGYYSKPPLVAWIIAFSTALFGEGTFGVRAAAPLFHFATSLLVFAIAQRLYDARVGCWAAVSFLTLPGISVSSAIISTDVPLLLFWAAALYAFIRARAEEGWAWWLACGVAIGLGMLAKYAMAYWVLSAALFLGTFREERRHLARFIAAIGVGAVVYAPNILWNSAHRFVSYAHTRDNANLQGSLFRPGELAEFVGSQFGVFGPLLFAALVIFLARRAWTAASDRLLVCFTLPVLLIVVALSLLSRSNANWAAPAYVSATVLVVAWLFRMAWRRVVFASVALHLVIAAALFGGYRAANLVGLDVDPWRRLHGWSELGRAVSRLYAERPLSVIGSEDRDVLAALAYYVRPGPPAIGKLNSDGRVQDHFDLTADMALFPGRDFLWVTRAEDVGFVAPFFASAQKLATVRLFAGPPARRRYEVWELRDFKGYGPS